MRIDWNTVLPIAVTRVYEESGRFGTPPTLRRLHYLLVSDTSAREAGYVNTIASYKGLSDKSARARENGTFPDLEDRTRTIDWPTGYSSPAQMLERAAANYAIDRAEQMPINVLLLVEKDGLVPILNTHFGWLTTAALKGYPSVSFVERLAGLARRDERPTVAIVASDYDPSGLDLVRHIGGKLPFPVVRVALTRAQVDENGIPPMPAKTTDSRLARMQESEGEAMQVEMDAMPAELLLAEFAAAITDVSGVSIRADGSPDMPEIDVLEASQLAELRAFAASWEAGR